MAKSPLKKAIEIAGGQAALADHNGSTQGHVSKWLERNYVPPEFVLSIEEATGVSRHDLRPDIYPAEFYGFREADTPPSWR
jgi:DNA-binding transcriptional regulator YdaS (Cro superfamily)